MRSLAWVTTIDRTYRVLDRGPRPSTRGWAHLIAAFVAAIGSAVLITFAWMTLRPAEALSVSVYCAGLILLFAVSGLYHRGPWKSAETVQWWRRADHSTIAIFIASTYTPLCTILLEPPYSTWLLVIAWAGAALGVVLNMVWINHPRWLDVAVYITLGWLVLPILPVLRTEADPEVILLLFFGGVAYTVGAIIYGFKWPGREARHYGYHEHFHTLTIVAAALHLVAIWIIVVQAGQPALPQL
ncbi:PAQR family membrane homeostasis protein TrhA [Corynebacterium lipophiloflavum]|uniref:Channel protein, hemolysin III family n=1 Tax=Corynebacterium lipophiloflavum (strain ATCC 700352 / DSM 44291 / CCUG 37336 / JCM 10383 / DMMZ 1944) TaxID=525263 RepID=C0XPQ2_CORLD|nr:hemolysin III family protein [Corynebacterium lipophiloflavum]EEI17798.1 channel protein, hemolysin III family [Corynebacterium lipophiloflavum DSM 44291]